MPDQRGPGGNGNEWVLHSPQSPSITGTSSSDRLLSYPGHSLVSGGVLLPLQSCSLCILQPQSTGQLRVNVKTVLFQIIHFSINTQFKCKKTVKSRNHGLVQFNP